MTPEDASGDDAFATFDVETADGARLEGITIRRVAVGALQSVAEAWIRREDSGNLGRVMTQWSCAGGRLLRPETDAVGQALSLGRYLAVCAMAVTDAVGFLGTSEVPTPMAMAAGRPPDDPLDRAYVQAFFSEAVLVAGVPFLPMGEPTLRVWANERGGVQCRLDDRGGSPGLRYPADRGLVRRAAEVMTRRTGRRIRGVEAEHDAIGSWGRAAVGANPARTLVESWLRYAGPHVWSSSQEATMRGDPLPWDMEAWSDAPRRPAWHWEEADERPPEDALVELAVRCVANLRRAGDVTVRSNAEIALALMEALGMAIPAIPEGRAWWPGVPSLEEVVGAEVAAGATPLLDDHPHPDDVVASVGDVAPLGLGIGDAAREIEIAPEGPAMRALSRVPATTWCGSSWRLALLADALAIVRSEGWRTVLVPVRRRRPGDEALSPPGLVAESGDRWLRRREWDAAVEVPDLDPLLGVLRTMLVAIADPRIPSVDVACPTDASGEGVFHDAAFVVDEHPDLATPVAALSAAVAALAPVGYLDASMEGFVDGDVRAHMTSSYDRTSAGRTVSAPRLPPSAILRVPKVRAARRETLAWLRGNGHGRVADDLARSWGMGGGGGSGTHPGEGESGRCR